MPEKATGFLMHGAREVLTLAGTAIHLEQQVYAIESAVIQSPNLATDLARTLVETVCKTILNDRGQSDCDRFGFKDLLKATYAAVQLVPDEKLTSSESLAAVRQLAENLDAAILGLSQLRKAEGLASHGKDAYFPSLEGVQAEFAARAADALVTFLYKSHRRYSGATLGRLLDYLDNPKLNEYIDSNNETIAIFDLNYRPSEVLFSTDRLAYVDFVTNFEEDIATESEEAE